jgi:hypothetical protein
LLILIFSIETPPVTSQRDKSPAKTASDVESSTTSQDLSFLDATMQEIEESLHDLSEQTTPTPAAEEEGDEEEEDDSDDSDDEMEEGECSGRGEVGVALMRGGLS